MSVIVSAESSAIGLLPQRWTPCPYVHAPVIASQLAFLRFLKYDVPSKDQLLCLRPYSHLGACVGV
jgi:hypothetical protein